MRRSCTYMVAHGRRPHKKRRSRVEQKMSSLFFLERFAAANGPSVASLSTAYNTGVQPLAVGHVRW